MSGTEERNTDGRTTGDPAGYTAATREGHGITDTSAGDSVDAPVEPEEGRVITVGWQTVLLPVVAVGVATAGFLLGCQGAAPGSNAPSAAATDTIVGAQTTEAAPGGRVIDVGDVSGGSVTINLGPAVTPQVTPVVESTTPQLPPVIEVAPGSIITGNEVVALPEVDHPLLGKAAPDFTMPRVDTGEQVSITGLKGQPLLVTFWATWCAPCRLEMPWFQNAYDLHKDEGFVVLAVDAGEQGIPPDMINETVQRFADSIGLTFPILLGDNTFQVQKEWTVLGLPATFLVDRGGTVVEFHSGVYPNQATLDEHLKQILEPAPEG